MSSVSEKRARSGEGIRANILFGLAVSTLLVGGVGAWAATTSLAGAVIASGNVVVESNSKKVQHQTGGIVGEILVREGDRVSAGDVIVRLDETMTRANLQIIAQQYDRTVARQARLQAERLGLAEIKFPEELAQRAADPDVETVLAGEKALFESRTKASTGLKSQLEARSGQLKKQIEGLTSQKKATEEAAALVERDSTSLQKLYQKKLVSLERVSELQLELSRLQGETGRLAAAIAETEGKISETKLQAIQVDEDMRKDVNEELRELDGKEVELIERKTVAKDQLARTEIRAPQSGFVQELAVHTVGGVITPGETLMLIVPEQDRLVIDAMVAPGQHRRRQARAAGVHPLPGLRRRHHARMQGNRAAGIGRPHQGPAAGGLLFRRQDHPRRPRRLPQGRQAPAARHAGGGPHPDRRAQRPVLRDEAAVGPDEPGVQGVAASMQDAWLRCPPGRLRLSEALPYRQRSVCSMSILGHTSPSLRLEPCLSGGR